jgi:hypothetical protein
MFGELSGLEKNFRTSRLAQRLFVLVGLDIYRFEKQRRVSLTQATSVIQMKGMGKELSEIFIQEAKQRLLENQLGESNTFVSEKYEIVPIVDGQIVKRMFDF